MDGLYLNWDEKDKDGKDYSKRQEIERCNSDVDMKLCPKYQEDLYPIEHMLISKIIPFMFIVNICKEAVTTASVIVYAS